MQAVWQDGWRQYSGTYSGYVIHQDTWSKNWYFREFIHDAAGWLNILFNSYNLIFLTAFNFKMHGTLLLCPIWMLITRKKTSFYVMWAGLWKHSSKLSFHIHHIFFTCSLRFIFLIFIGKIRLSGLLFLILSLSSSTVMQGTILKWK